MTAGQRTMATAFIYPEAEKGGRGKRNPVETIGFSRERLSRARTVLRNSHPMATNVLSARLRPGCGTGRPKRDCAAPIARRAWRERLRVPAGWTIRACREAFECDDVLSAANLCRRRRSCYSSWCALSLTRRTVGSGGRAGFHKARERTHGWRFDFGNGRGPTFGADPEGLVRRYGGAGSLAWDARSRDLWEHTSGATKPPGN